MSKAPLPNRIDARRSADQGVNFEHCSLALNRLSRLVSYLIEPEGEVNVSLFFGVDDQKQRFLEGTAEVDVKMRCQRCLEPVDVKLSAELNLGIVANEEAAKTLPQRYDPLVIKADNYDPADAVEDELILTLPLIPAHSDCEVKTEYGSEHAEAEGDTKDNPFSILAQLKSKKH